MRPVPPRIAIVSILLILDVDSEAVLGRFGINDGN